MELCEYWHGSVWDVCLRTLTFSSVGVDAPDQTILPELILSQHLILLQSFSSPPVGSEALKLKAVIGYNGNGRGNMVWNPDTGTLGMLWSGLHETNPSGLDSLKAEGFY